MKIIAIVGGGFCGSQCAKILDKNFPSGYRIILFDKKEYFEYTPSVHKIITDKSYKRKIIIPYSRFLKKAELIKDEVVSVTSKVIKTKYKEYKFDFLVVASGSLVKAPFEGLFTLKSAIDADKIRKFMKNSGTVAVVGGGYTGIEVSGELALKTKKKIILVHALPRIIERQYYSSSKLAHRFLEKSGVSILLDRKIEHVESRKLMDHEKKKIHSDFIIWCAGVMPNTKICKFSKPGSYIKVDQYLKVAGYDNIFAGGDITDIKEEKNAQNAEIHGKIIAENILNSIKNRSLIAYESKKRAMIISIGDWYSIFSYKNFSFGGIIPAIMKKFIEVKTMLKYRI